MTASILQRAAALEAGGDLLAAYDAVAEGLAADPASLPLRHRAVLLLARCGARGEARRMYLRLGLDAVRDHVDTMALGGRLLKDLAFAATGEARRQYAKESAAKYAEAYALHRGYYPGINTATMALLAGDRAQSAARAREVLESLSGKAAGAPEDAYYRAATRAEALFLLGRVDEAETALADAIACDPTNYPAHASTARQLDVICAALGLDRAWLARHSPPPALSYCGHMFGDNFPAAAEIAAGVAKALDRLRPGAAFGALAAGADIVIAEAALARGAELHVVLPMAEADFIARSVAPFGAGWVQRYQAARAQAKTFRFASHEADVGDDTVFAIASEYAMGLALRHAEGLRTEAHQLGVWDGVASAGAAGTGADVRRWAATKRPKEIVPFPPRAASNASVAPVNADARILKAMLFGDVRGFSKLQESHIKPFVEKVLGPLSAVLKDAARTDFVATWGDGIYIVCPGVAEAAEAALAMQDGFARLDLAGAGLPTHLALRLGGHFGPVAPLTDPFVGTPGFYGTHVTIAARIEPVAVPGTVYVSEPFAALLALEAPGRFSSEYVGQTEMPKGFGTMRLFALKRAEQLG